MKSSFLPKYKQKIVKISALTTHSNWAGLAVLFSRQILNGPQEYFVRKITYDNSEWMTIVFFWTLSTLLFICHLRALSSLKDYRKKCPPLIRIKYGHFDSSWCHQIWRIHHFWATIWWKVRGNCACNSSDIYRKARHLQLEFRHGITTVVEFSKYGPTFERLGQIVWKMQNNQCFQENNSLSNLHEVFKNPVIFLVCLSF